MNPNFVTILRGVGSHRKQSANVRTRKAPRRGVEDSPQHVSTVVVVAKEIRPPPSSTSTPQTSFEAGSIMSLRSQAKAQVEEELSLIATSALSLSCMDLAFALVHLAPKLP